MTKLKIFLWGGRVGGQGEAGGRSEGQKWCFWLSFASILLRLRVRDHLCLFERPTVSFCASYQRQPVKLVERRRQKEAKRSSPRLSCSHPFRRPLRVVGRIRRFRSHVRCRWDFWAEESKSKIKTVLVGRERPFSYASHFFIFQKEENEEPDTNRPPLGLAWIGFRSNISETSKHWICSIWRV